MSEDRDDELARWKSEELARVEARRRRLNPEPKQERLIDRVLAEQKQSLGPMRKEGR